MCEAKGHSNDHPLSTRSETHIPPWAHWFSSRTRRNLPTSASSPGQAPLRRFAPRNFAHSRESCQRGRPIEADPPFPDDANIVVTESVYAGDASLIIPRTTVLPNGALATADGSYPNVFNNESADPQFRNYRAGLSAAFDQARRNR
jgi:hypothetical protein